MTSQPITSKSVNPRNTDRDTLAIRRSSENQINDCSQNEADGTSTQSMLELKG